MPQHVIPPITSILVFENDVLVKRKHYPRRQEAQPARGVITEFSDSARRRLALVAANTYVTFRTLITLTYPNEFETNGRECKRHLNVFLKWLWRDLGHKCSYLWCCEFQKRGALHFHLGITCNLPQRSEARKAFKWRVSANWYRIVGSGDPKHLVAGTRVERVRKPHGAKRYFVKYAAKMEQKIVPECMRDVGRFYGYSRDVTPQPIARFPMNEESLRFLLDDWPYKPHPERPIYKVLYNFRQQVIPRDEPTNLFASQRDDAGHVRVRGRSGRGKLPRAPASSGSRSDGCCMSGVRSVSGNQGVGPTAMGDGPPAANDGP